jgi:hypothetical protein
VSVAVPQGSELVDAQHARRADDVRAAAALRAAPRRRDAAGAAGPGAGQRRHPPVSPGRAPAARGHGAGAGARLPAVRAHAPGELLRRALPAVRGGLHAVGAGPAGRAAPQALRASPPASPTWASICCSRASARAPRWPSPPSRWRTSSS